MGAQTIAGVLPYIYLIPVSWDEYGEKFGLGFVCV